jgi:hypothetical protein
VIAVHPLNPLRRDRLRDAGRRDEQGTRAPAAEDRHRKRRSHEGGLGDPDHCDLPPQGFMEMRPEPGAPIRG